VIHGIEGQPCVSAANKQPRCRELMGRQSLTDEKDNREWLLDDPMLKVQNPKTCKRNETGKRE
jgi:hypothetical protein